MEHITQRFCMVATNLNVIFFSKAYVQAFSILHFKKSSVSC